MRFRVTMLLTITVVAALAGCAPATQPQGASTPATAPTATPSASTPTPGTPAPTKTDAVDTAPVPAAEPERLVVSASSLRVLLSDGTVGEEFGYLEPIAPIVDAMTALFGVAPTITTYEGNAAADYDWNGIKIGTDGPTSSPQSAETIVFVSAAEVNGIQIETVDGLQIGDDIHALEAANPDDSHRSDLQGTEQLDISIDQVPVDPDNPERMFSVGLTASPSTGPLTRFGAPMKNFE